MISVASLICLIRRMNESVCERSASGSGGLPTTNENSGTMPCAFIRRASSIVRSADAVPPLFMRFSISVDPDSAPQNTIFRPLRRPGRVLVSHQLVDTAERPPGHAERGQSFRDRLRARFGDEEVHVVKLH